jgi:hAT family C-terminal dimerisation region
VFDTLPSLNAPKPHELGDELDRYLSIDPEAVEDVLMWWHGRRAMYPCLSRMALDYLTIPGVFPFQCLSVSSNNPFPPATSVDVERTFSRGRLVLSHVRSRLSAQSTWALLCLGSWSLLGLVKDTDVLAVTVLDEVNGNEG